ncbi:MAG TPA: PEP/pyruvate-binding domain-containing protein [Thermoflexales bacterium]|nr:PEP/pyruvate-binding domain-containing protein [Thermoflexales bacterium]
MPEPLINTRHTIVAFTVHDLPSVDQAGGKALALIQMTAAGMPVPPGFVLTVAFFAPWTAVLRSTPAWAAMANADAAGIGATARALQAACQTLRLTEGQKDELDRALNAFRAEYHGHLFAVRSSSPEEDLEGASFAGGYETMLGVTVEGIEAAIRRAFTSSFDARVFLYKREHGFPLDQPRIAVIVQQQVDADSAGVAFSLNPLNNCFDEAVINANHGLGESVVSGDADPDVFVVDKLRGEILETRIGAKQSVIRLDSAGSTLRSTRPNQAEAAITPAQALELTRLLEKVEAYYKKPVDIEWAISDGRLFLLQARPITTYRPLPDEMLTAPGQPKRLYANSTLIEQGLQDPLSVLGTDFLGYVLDKVGGPVAEGAIGIDGITFTAGGGYFMNLSFATMLGMRNAGLAPGSFGDPRVLEILDNIDMKQYLGGELPAKLKALRGKMMFSLLPMLASALGAYLRPERILAKYEAALPDEIRRLEAMTGDGLSLRAQARALTELLRFFYADHGIPMILAGQFAERRMRGLFKQDAAQAHDHLINLGISLPGNKTAEMGEALYGLASSSEISRYASAEHFLADLDAGRLSPEFSAAWANFMREFGMRCPTEIDPATPRPREQPSLLFEQLKNMAQAACGRDSAQPFFEVARARREASYRALLAMAQKRGSLAAHALKGYYKTWTLLGGYRETPKHYVITVIDLFRGRALAIARAFVSAGRLDAPEQIFDLTIADIDRATADAALDLRALARERSALTNKVRRNKQVVRIIDSRGKIFFPPRKAGAAGELIGVPISPGVVQGRVKVFQHASDKTLLPGEILVARATDPGWTPLFIDARGIILEIGGALQHGAVVAREYGIPCVSGVDDATSRLKDGQLVEVDGSNGVVRILAE